MAYKSGYATGYLESSGGPTLPTECLTTAWLETVRITATDSCGIPGEEYVVSDGLVTVTISPETDDGVEIFKRKANGDICVNRRQANSLKRYTVDIDWCEVDPDVMRLIAGARGETDSGDTVGYRLKTGTLDQAFALEGWTALGTDPCDSGGECYGYFLFPLLRGGILSPDDFGGEGTNFQTQGHYTQDGAQWDTGPYSVIGSPGAPTVLDNPILSDEIFLHRRTCVAPPTPSCGAVALSPGSPA